MNTMTLIISILWCLLGGTVVISNGYAINQAENDFIRFIVVFIFIAFAPVFILNNILEFILDVLLPPGDDDEGTKGGGFI